MNRFLILIVFIIYNSYIGIAQPDAVSEYRKAKSEIYYKDYQLAEQTLAHLIESGNNDALCYVLLGENFSEQGKYEEAIEHYKTAYKLKNNDALLYIAECYAHIGNELKATEYLKAYLQTNDKQLQSQIKLNPNFKAIEHSKAWINLWKEEHYNNYELKLDEAGFLLSKEDYNAAFEIVDELLYKNKRRHKALEIRGDLFMKTKDYLNAAKTYTTASNFKNQNYDYTKKAATAWFLSKKYNKAIHYCDQALLNRPENIELLILKTKIELQQNKYDDAQQTINTYINYFPDYSEALFLAGIAAYRKSEYIKALENFNLSIEKLTSNSEYFEKRADTYMEVSMYENAVNDYSMSLDLNPKLAEIYYKRGIVKIKAHQEDACNDFKKALELGYYKSSDYIVKYCE